LETTRQNKEEKKRAAYDAPDKPIRWARGPAARSIEFVENNKENWFTSCLHIMHIFYFLVVLGVNIYCNYFPIQHHSACSKRKRVYIYRNKHIYSRI